MTALTVTVGDLIDTARRLATELCDISGPMRSKVFTTGAFLAALPLLGAGLVGCGPEESTASIPFTPATSPAPSTDGPTSTSGEKEATSTAAATAEIEPCSLLNKRALTRYGSFTGPKSEYLGGARVCGFQRKLASASDIGLGVSINVRDKQGISTVNDVGDGLVSGKVNGRDAVKASSSETSACMVALAVGDKARVDVSITADNVQIACKVADRIVNIVEPKLPKS